MVRVGAPVWEYRRSRVVVPEPPPQSCVCKPPVSVSDAVSRTRRGGSGGNVSGGGAFSVSGGGRDGEWKGNFPEGLGTGGLREDR